MNLIFILMKISFPSKEVYPKFTSVILHGPTVEWRWQGCWGVGAAGGAVPPREHPPPPPRDRYVIWAGRHGDRERSGAAPRLRMVGARRSAEPRTLAKWKNRYNLIWDKSLYKNCHFEDFFKLYLVFVLFHLESISVPEIESLLSRTRWVEFMLM